MTLDNAPRTLSVEVLKRGLSQQDFDKLIGLYRSSRKVARQGKRLEGWSKELTKAEHGFLHEVMNTRDSVKIIAEKYGFEATNSAYSKLVNVALRYLYQNRESLV